MIYLLSVIPEGFKELDLAGDADYMTFDCMRWNGKPKLQNWKKPQLAWVDDEFSSSDDQVGDFTKFMGGALALSERAKAVLEPVIGNQAEFLPASGEGRQWYLVNVINVQNVLDVERSKFKTYEDGHVGPCTHAYITEPVGGNEIFLVERYFPHIFISEVVKTAIDTAGLTGALVREYRNPT
jgi:hypothetical protein